MDRLVVGDVGYGKTEVALRAAFKAAQDGKQVAVLVPTTVLAAQHNATFSQRFAAFPLEVRLLSRFVSAEGAGSHDRGSRRRERRHRHRHAPPAEQGRPLQGPGPRRRRRGAAVRGRGEGEAQAAPPRGRRADPVRDADPAHAQPGDGRHPRPQRHRDAARGPAADPDPGRRGLGGARPRRDPARARPRRPGLLRPQPGRDDRGAGRAAPPAPAGCAIRRRARPDAGGCAREGDDRLRRRGGRRARVHDDHRIGARHPEREHDHHRSRGHARIGAALPASRAGGSVVAAGLRLPALPAAGTALGRGAQAAAGHLQRLGARGRVPDRAVGPRDPRCRQHPRRRAVGAHGGGRLRPLLADARRGGRGAEGEARGSGTDRRGAHRPSSTCRSMRTCPTTTSPTRPRSSSCTGGSRRRARRAISPRSGRRPRTGSARCRRR